ncbi:MAG: LysR family transcriptional regulator [Clostridia bacterium]|nr:LysR family transcriptional regulator [Clostridia bacterium]
MELLQLKYFCHAAETQNFSKTAKEFEVPASNISQMIHRLEKELETTLFDRSANRVQLNEKGTAFYKKVKEALICLDEAQRIALDHNETGGEIHLRICTNRRLITDVIGQFRKLFPKVTFVLNFDNSSDNSLDDFDLLISEDVDDSNLEKIKLIDEKILLAVENKQSKYVNKKDFSNLKFITMSKGSSIHKITRNICNLQGFEPNIVIQSDDPFYLRKYVSLGLGVAFFPEKSWKGQFADNVKLMDVTDFKRSTYVFRHKNRYMTKPLKAFLEMLIIGAKKY